MRQSLFIIWLLATAPLWAPGAHAQREPQRIALLIGNQGYGPKVGALRNPHNDVTLIERALKSLHFKVTVLRDAGYRKMDVAIKEHIAAVREAGRGAISFVYYSGHGVANPKTNLNYLIPVDVPDAGDSKLWSLAFEQNDLIEKLNRQAPRATHYVVFDACRNELMLPGDGKSPLGAEKGFVPVPQTAGLLVAYSTAPKQTASDFGEGGGPYAKVLAEELVRPGIEAVAMFRNVQLRVKQTIGQDPWLSFPSLPEVYLAGRPAPAQPSEAARAWDEARKSPSVAVLEAFSKQFPGTVYAAMATERIASLQKQDEDRRRAEADAKARAEAKARADAQAKTEADARAKAEADARAKAGNARAVHAGTWTVTTNWSGNCTNPGRAMRIEIGRDGRVVDLRIDQKGGVGESRRDRIVSSSVGADGAFELAYRVVPTAGEPEHVNILTGTLAKGGTARSERDGKAMGCPGTFTITKLGFEDLPVGAVKKAATPVGGQSSTKNAGPPDILDCQDKRIFRIGDRCRADGKVCTVKSVDGQKANLTCN
ncbi:MAG: caspase family protein [Hyphomicrobiales bacterium]|nr:caspase family protein [Hyphomicrobiales bacterium]